MNVLIESSSKKGPTGSGAILSSTSSFTYQYTTAPVLRGIYWNDLQLTFSTFTIQSLLTGSFTNVVFDCNVVIANCTGFLTFNSCTFNSGFMLTIQNSNSCSIFFNFCNFSSDVITNNVQLTNTNTNIFVSTCTGLRNFTDLQATGRAFYSGTNATATDSRLYVATKSPYDAITGAQYLWQNADIAGLAYSKLTGVPTSFASKISILTADANLALTTYKINTTATTWASNEWVPKSYVDGAIGSANMLSSDNTFTGINTFNGTTKLKGNNSYATPMLDAGTSTQLLLNSPATNTGTVSTNSTTINWKGANGNVEIATDNSTTGDVNIANLGATRILSIGNTTGGIMVNGTIKSAIINKMTALNTIGLAWALRDTNPGNGNELGFFQFDTI
jgi:hypothetical protein